jgi:hypothetical protein
MERSGMLRPTYRDLSHDTKRCLKTKTTNLQLNPAIDYAQCACCTTTFSSFSSSQNLKFYEISRIILPPIAHFLVVQQPPVLCVVVRHWEF